jgi:uncharacterized protein YjdB
MPIVVGIALMACGRDEPTSSDTSSVPVVLPGSVTYPSIDITPREARLVPGSRLSLYLALKGFGNDLTDRTGTWTSSDTTVVQVSRVIANGASSSSIPSAVAKAVGAGSATITVWVGGRSATVEITVTEANEKY